MTRRHFPLAAFMAACALFSAACGVHLDDVPRRQLAQTSFVYAADDRVITQLHAVEDRVVLRTSQIPTWIRDAAVAIEDRRFYLHHGIDGRAILRASYVNIRDGSVEEGGSTITQQLVKNLYTGTDRTISRKVSEAMLAWQLEDRLTKDEILTRYLNTVYFGKGAYGVQAAARTFFDIDAKKLDLSQSALLAGLITSPGHFDPYTYPRRAVGRRRVVLRLMNELGMITAAQRRHARKQPIHLHQVPAVGRYDYPYFVDYLKEWFLTNPAFGETREDRYRLLFTGGLRIHTTLQPAVQEASQRAVDSVLSYPGDPSAAVTVLDPRRGFVLAMVGGDQQDYWRDRDAGRVNLATAAGGTGRQSGSAFKPFALMAALESGLSASETYSAPSSLQIPLEGGGVWNVTNAEGAGYGAMTLRAATVHSVNTVYAQVIDRLGPNTVVEVAQRMGLRCCRRVSNPRRPLKPYLSAVLGTNEVNTLEMASAYGTLATGGLRVRPVPVSRVTDARGTILWEADIAPRTRPRPSTHLRREQHPERSRPLRDGNRGEHRTSPDREDRDGDGPFGRLVRGRDPPDGGIGVGRLPAGPGPDGATEDTDHRLRRNVAGTDLAAADARGRSRSPRDGVPPPGCRIRLRRGRRHAGAVLPPQPVHAPPEHPDPAVHRGHGANEDLHVPLHACSEC